MKKIDKKTILTYILTGICILGIVYSSIKIIEWKINTNKNKDIKEEIQEYIKIEKTETEEEKYIVDFKKLKEQNEDTIGYLKVNNTDVEYVVVKGNNNEYYLNHNFNKEYNVAGWIFADYKNNFDGTDKNIVIYGHNMQDGSMFASLKNILSNDWQNNTNKEIKLVTEQGTITYQIFSSYIVEAEDYYITTNFQNDESFRNFINTVSNRTYYNYNVEVNESDNILTLSTCTGNGKDRIVIHAKQINLEQN